MNSWDEDPDELLRQRWQQTFADFEVRPRSSLSRRILDQLPTRNQRRPVLWVVGGLFLFVSAGLFYKNRLEKSSRLKHGITAGQPTVPVQPLSASRAPLPTAPAGRSVPTGQPGISLEPNEAVAKQPTVCSSIVRRVDPPGVVYPEVKALSEQRTPIRQLPAAQGQFRPWAGATLRANSVAAHQPRSKSVRSVGNRISTESSGPAESVEYKPMATLPDQSIHNTHDPFPNPRLTVDQPLANTVPIEWTRLKPLGILSILSQLSTLPNHLPAIRWGAAHSVKSVVAHPSPHWFVEVMPLSSFQWMSASPTSTTYLSHVDAPAAFSPATWGYQINGGIRFQRWQANLSMGQLRRWAYYTINENRYRVESSLTNPNQLVRETYAVAENVLLPMIGIGLSQERLLAQGRYTVELGGQVSYLPTGNQTLVGLRGGARRRLPVSRNTELQVGLTAEYGLNRLLNEKHQLVIHPLVIGLGLQIQPRSGHP